MKSPTVTDHELEKLACLESSHTYAASIRVKADDRRTYFFATSHFIDGVIEANSDRVANVPPERLVLRFTTGEVTVLGSGLDRIEDRLAEGRLRGLKTVDPHHVSVLRSGPVILHISVERKNEV
jgi:hypothetical protein